MTHAIVIRIDRPTHHRETCPICGHGYRADERAVWTGTVGTVHARCWRARAA